MPAAATLLPLRALLPPLHAAMMPRQTFFACQRHATPHAAFQFSPHVFAFSCCCQLPASRLLTLLLRHD